MYDTPDLVGTAGHDQSEPDILPPPPAALPVVVRPRPRPEAVTWGPPHHQALFSNASERPSSWLAAVPERPHALHDSWWMIAAAALAASSVIAGVLWISTHVDVDPTLHTVALFVHLASLVLGFGAVLVADYLVLVWLSGRCTLAEAIAGASRLHLPIWAGLAGLIASGSLLEPNLASGLTRTKVSLVLVLTINGLQALILSRRIAQHVSIPLTRRLMVWGASTALVSQICWWGAVWIGFWNAEH
ncbi:hypothetical protein [Rhodococcus maanshanensis]|uniref:Uncharacterized protein n=1 Tax=Rhodococcus maanshanensis TaxID=183556 RepID=A0A1H7U9F3_9NOCA|nr:hypothetical protein [Rhodococcus maanshanensis]SEL93459.1 hypothetical protein SAMN05444583_117111 [Rhodococcus maanshanensis]